MITKTPTLEIIRVIIITQIIIKTITIVLITQIITITITIIITISQTIRNQIIVINSSKKENQKWKNLI